MLDISAVLEAVQHELPEITVKKLTKEEIAVTLNGDPCWMAKFAVGDRYVWCDYDYPEKKLSQIHLCKVSGPVIVNGEETLEIHCKKYNLAGEFENETYSYYSVKRESATKLLFIMRDSEGKGKIEDVEDTIPLCIRTNQRWKSKESYRSGKLLREYSRIEEIDGPYIVRIGKRESKCIRWSMASAPKEEKKEFAEAFIAIDSGLTFLFRRYNGSGWDNLDKLKDSPKLQHNSDIYYMWYNSIPLRNIKD